MEFVDVSNVDGPLAVNQTLPKQDMPYGLLVGIGDTGYGVAKSLAKYGIPLIALEKDPTRPEAKTRFCQSVEYYRDENELHDRIVAVCKRLKQKPVLYLSGDALVSFYSTRRSSLSQLVHIAFPNADVVETLLEKTKFAEFAERNDFKIPKTIVPTSARELVDSVHQLRYPCVVKPAWRSSSWKLAKFPKVFVFENAEKLQGRFGEIFAVERDLIVQDWIPGGDSEIYFCLTYFDGEGNCLADFTGRKLRQWPVGTGSTACAVPVDAPEVTAETLRLFKLVGLAGFGSVEFKRHLKTGEYFIMEPTVGRPNHQSFIATANGVDIPGIAYRSLTGVNLPLPVRSKKPVTWIDDQFDLLSILVSGAQGKLNFSHLIKSYFGKKSFRFLSLTDTRPLASMLLQAPFKLKKYVTRKR